MLQLFNYNAGKGDCLRLRFKGLSGARHNIVIDAGVSRFGPRFAAIGKDIAAAGEQIDVLIITHMDDDHLGGLLYNMRQGKTLPVKEVWINSRAGMSAGLSVRQNNELYGRLVNAKIPVREALAGNVYDMDGAHMEILWPDRDTAEKFYAPDTVSTPLSGRCDYGYDIEELMDMPLKEKDTSFSNRNSVVFSFAYEHKNFLFTGDAWSEDILSAAGGKAFDFIKLPHHGSARNLTENWHGRIVCRNYMVCTDGISHPNKQTIAKLLKWNGEITVYGSVPWWNQGFLTENDKKLLDKLHFIEGEETIW